MRFRDRIRTLERALPSQANRTLFLVFSDAEAEALPPLREGEDRIILRMLLGNYEDESKDDILNLPQAQIAREIKYAIADLKKEGITQAQIDSFLDGTNPETSPELQETRPGSIEENGGTDLIRLYGGRKRKSKWSIDRG